MAASCSSHKTAEGNLFRKLNGDYYCACTGKTKAKYPLSRFVRRHGYDDDDDDDDDDKDYRDCIINYWECPIA